MDVATEGTESVFRFIERVFVTLWSRDSSEDFRTGQTSPLMGEVVFVFGVRR